MKRYPAYKSTNYEWLGEVPLHWDLKKLKFNASVRFSSVDKKSEEGEQPVRLCNYVDVYYNDAITPNMDFMEATASPEEIRKFMLKPGDVLLTKDSEEWDDIAIPAYVTFEQADVICGYHLAQVRPNATLIDGKYIFYFLKSYRTNYQFKIEASGVTRYGLSNYALNNSLTLIPPIREQIAITNYLDRKTAQIDDLIAKKERMIELLKEERAAIINQAVTRGLNQNVELKDSGIEWLGKVPKHWQIKRLRFVVNINPQRTIGIQPETMCVFIPMEAMNADGTFNNSEFRPFLDVKSGFTYFAENDVIFAKITPCFENGKGALLKNLGSSVGFGSTEFHVLRADKNKTIPEYLYFLTISGLFRVQGEAFMQGVAGQKRVTTDFVQDFTIGIPPVDEQRKIALFLDRKTAQIDGQVERAKKSIELLKEYRTALISEVVTGKIDVREISDAKY